MELGDKLLILSKKLTLKKFKQAARKVPFYKEYLERFNVDYKRIKNIEDFRKTVPILNKETLFSFNLIDIKKICKNGSLKGCVSILPSSGFSGKFSFGLSVKKDLKEQLQSTNRLLNFTFKTRRKRTLIINALPMGITVPATEAVIVNTGPRSDIVIYVLRAFAKEFEQTIITGDNNFVKNTIEQGIEEGFDWPNFEIHIIIGGESFPENFRSYLTGILGADKRPEKNPVIGSSFGTAEIGLNVFFETRQSIALRKKLADDEQLKSDLLGEHFPFCPMLFQYNPLRVYAEEDNHQLLLTDLNRNAILPIVRYATADEAIIIAYEKMKQVFSEHKLKEYLPPNILPFIFMITRKTLLDFNESPIYPDAVKKIIYTIPGLAPLVTGYFRILKINTRLTLAMQVKEKKEVSDALKEKFKGELNKNLKNEFQVIFYPYHEFPYGMELNYEKKVQYI